MTLPKSLLLLASTLLLTQCRQEPPKQVYEFSRDKIDWKYQSDSLLMPFWMMEEALGDPPGNYQTNRNEDGTVIYPATYDYSGIPPIAAPFLLGPTDSLRRDFIRLRSRQIYAYCMAYHLSGNAEYLLRARQGLDYLLTHGVYENNSVVTYRENGKAMPSMYQRNAQDLAYGLLGVTAYYYLTRDPEILDLILRVKRNIWRKYFEESDLQEHSKLMYWVKQDFEEDSAHQKDLLAPLDMLNAHFILMSTVVPDSLKQEYLSNVHDLAYSLKDNFYSPEYNMFWGRLNQKNLTAPHTDFAHSIKSFWMLYSAGRIIDDTALTTFAERGAGKLLETAFLKSRGRWASKYLDESLTPDTSIFTWEFAELDQMSATLSLRDTSFYTRYLKYTYPFFQEKLINYENKETYVAISADDEPLHLGLRSGFHISGFHTLEHALIGYLSTANYYGDDIELFYAFHKSGRPGRNAIQPYTYSARIKTYEETVSDTAFFPKLIRTRVIFRNID